MSQMKCPNCGAQMDVHPDKDFQFCSYCGTKVEKKDVPPETLAGAIYGIGKEYLKTKKEREELAYKLAKEREEYDRTHHATAKMLAVAFGGFIFFIGLLLLLGQIGFLNK